MTPERLMTLLRPEPRATLPAAPDARPPAHGFAALLDAAPKTARRGEDPAATGAATDAGAPALALPCPTTQPAAMTTPPVVIPTDGAPQATGSSPEAPAIGAQAPAPVITPLASTPVVAAASPVAWPGASAVASPPTAPPVAGSPLAAPVAAAAPVVAAAPPVTPPVATAAPAQPAGFTPVPAAVTPMPQRVADTAPEVPEVVTPSAPGPVVAGGKAVSPAGHPVLADGWPARSDAPAPQQPAPAALPATAPPEVAPAAPPAVVTTGHGDALTPVLRAAAPDPLPHGAVARASEAALAAPPTPAPPIVPHGVPHRAVPLHRAPEAVATLLQLAADRGVSRARIHLRPAELGGIEVQISATAGGVAARLVADSPEAARMLAQAGDDLRRSLEARDVTLLSLEVSTSNQERRPSAQPRAATAPSGGPSETAIDDDLPTSPTALLELPGGLLVDVLA